MPSKQFRRGGYEVFNTMLKPIFDNPESLTYDFKDGVDKYDGEIMFISSECSFIGFEFQNKFHLPYFPNQTKHVLAPKMGHNFFTLNAAWSEKVIVDFLK